MLKILISLDWLRIKESNGLKNTNNKSIKMGIRDILNKKYFMQQNKIKGRAITRFQIIWIADKFENLSCEKFRAITCKTNNDAGIIKDIHAKSWTLKLRVLNRIKAKNPEAK